MNAIPNQQPLNIGPRSLAVKQPADVPEPYKKAIPILHSKPRSAFTLLQRKTANALLKHALENEPANDGFFEVTHLKLRKAIGINSNNVKHLRESTTTLMDIVFEWDVLAARDSRLKYKASALFPELEVTTKHVRYQVSSQMLPVLKSPGVYATIDMRLVRRFKKAASLAIWEFAIRFEAIRHTASMNWTDFRDMVLSDETAHSKTYQEYKYFKNRQLTPALAEIKSVTDHVLRLLEFRNGKNVEKIQFEVTKKKPPTNGLDADDLPTVTALNSIGIGHHEAVQCITQYGRGHVAAALLATKKRAGDKKLGPLESPAGWFRWKLRTPDAIDHVTTGLTDRPVAARVDFRQAYLTQRRREAEQYFNELGPEAQTHYMLEYDEQQRIPSLRVTSRKRKPAAAETFFLWLARKTWGEPTTEQVLEFAQEHIAH